MLPLCADTAIPQKMQICDRDWRENCLLLSSSNSFCFCYLVQNSGPIIADSKPLQRRATLKQLKISLSFTLPKLFFLLKIATNKENCSNGKKFSPF